jgi:hypothetical protein
MQRGLRLNRSVERSMGEKKRWKVEKERVLLE